MTPPKPLALELRNLHKRFGSSDIIRGTDLAIAPGERIALIGPMAPANRRCSI